MLITRHTVQVIHSACKTLPTAFSIQVIFHPSMATSTDKCHAEMAHVCPRLLNVHLWCLARRYHQSSSLGANLMATVWKTWKNATTMTSSNCAQITSLTSVLQANAPSIHPFVSSGMGALKEHLSSADLVVSAFQTLQHAAPILKIWMRLLRLQHQRLLSKINSQLTTTLHKTFARDKENIFAPSTDR